MEPETHRGPHSRCRTQRIPATGLANGKQNKAKASKANSTLWCLLVAYSFICSFLLTYFSSIYKLLALCNFICLQPQRRSEGVILEPSVEQALLSSGVSALSIWSQAHLGRYLPCIQRGLRPSGTPLTREGFPCLPSPLCVCEREESERVRNAGFRTKSPVSALGLTCCLNLSFPNTVWEVTSCHQMAPGAPAIITMSQAGGRRMEGGGVHSQPTSS